MGSLQAARHRARRRGVPSARQGRLPAGENELRRLLFSLAPLLRGEGGGEGLLPQILKGGEADTPSPAAQERGDLSPQAGRGKQTEKARPANRARFCLTGPFRHCLTSN